jgi:carboxymethylenebutenolidase
MSSTRYEDVAAPDGGSFAAYCAVPDRLPAPGILLLQEIFGINDNIRGLSERLAAQGYLVLAPDMFWRLDPGFESKDESGMVEGLALMQRLDFGLAAGDMAATVAHLRALPESDGRVGAVGFCLGGTLAFLAAATAKPDGRGLDAAVPYYGSGIHGMLELVPQIECPMLLHFGADDPYIPTEQIALVEAAVADRPDVTLLRYPAGHAFSNWDAPSFYRKEPADLAWERTLAFLAERLP